jgi:hypothetical protein
MNEKLTKQLDKIFLQIGSIIDGYEFYCSKDFKSNLKEYKGIKITYLNLLPKNSIYYCPTIYF